MLSGDFGGGVRYTFSDRGGGVGVAPYDTCNISYSVGDDPVAVAANRAAIAAAMGFDDRRIAFVRQVHGNGVEYATGPWPAGGLPSADAMVTRERGLTLAVLAADCAAVLLADPGAGVIGAAHSGRGGLAAGVVVRTVEQMAAAGAEPSRMHAVIGPTVCGKCYEVPAAMRAEIGMRLPEAVSTTRAGTPALDIPAGLIAQLLATGIASVRSVGVCTMESPAYFSHRRGEPGRCAGFVWMPDGPDGPAR